MDSNMDPHQEYCPGLLRFRSAPISFFEMDANVGLRFGDGLLDSSTTTIQHDEFSMNKCCKNGFSSSIRLQTQYPKITTINSMEVESSDESTRHGGINNGFNLNTQTTSPPAFFTNLIDPHHNGYAMMRGIGSLRGANSSDDESRPGTSKLTMGHLPQIPEIGSENIKETTSSRMNFRNPDDDACFDRPTGFSFISWNETASESEPHHSSENGRLTSRPNILPHHLSLPKTSAEMAAVEKLLHFQDTVPWKVRAKRGCATHPRSIAERVRRNRISERMKKLQGLVPNMDKQTNTADMLDLAVEYIKDLQDHYKVLCDNRARCNCVNRKHSATNQAT